MQTNCSTLPADADRALAETAARWSAALRRVELLSERERQTFRLLGAGFSNRAIAAELRVTERTVKAHVAAVLTKLEVTSRLQIGLVAQIHHLVYESTVSNSGQVADT